MVHLYRTAAVASSAPLGGDTETMRAWLRIASAWDGYLAGQYEQARADLNAPGITPTAAAAVWGGLQHSTSTPAPRGVVNQADVDAVHAHPDDLARESAELAAFVGTHTGCAQARALVVAAPY